MEKKFMDGGYGIINQFIAFKDAVELIAVNFDTVAVWAAIDSDIEPIMTHEAMICIDVGITDILFDLKNCPMGEFINRSTLGLKLMKVLGSLYFFERTEYE